MNAESLFAAALEKATPAERQAFLDSACSDDTALRQQMDRLLAADEKRSGILEHPGDAWAAGIASTPRLAADRVFAGRFTLRRKLGEGGMGEVWVADQTAPLRRRVALKVIRPGLDSARMLARFEQERQALALMDHPNISRVLDAGVDEDGRPYFAMELINGDPITKYCDEAGLSIKQRLELFLPVCRALQHAHQKGIIHRDLKPTNILIETLDGKPTPKVIDFGVAKAIGPRVTDQSVHTEVGMFIGTIEYMSPEQAELHNADIDTRSDIYSLGALLYELLAGSVPLRREELKSAGFIEALRMIREVDPPKPSARLAGSEPLTQIAALRQSAPKQLIGLIRGELDWIVVKCLEKDRNRRYETANGVARDIERYLNDEPVEAGPPSARYRLRKFVRRNWRWLGATAALTALLVVGVVSLSIALFEVKQASREKSAALNAELKRRQQARVALDTLSSSIIEEWLAKQPALEAQHREFLERALHMYEEFAADTSQDEQSRFGVALAQDRVGCIHELLGHRRDAEAAWNRCRDIYAALAADFPNVPDYQEKLAGAYFSLGFLYRESGRFDDAKAALEQSVSLHRRPSSGSASRHGQARAYEQLGFLFRDVGQARAAESACDQALATLRELTDEFPDQPLLRHDLARALISRGHLHDGARQFDEAKKSFADAIDILKRLIDEYPRNARYRETLGHGLRGLGTVLREMRRFGEAEQMFQRAVAIQEELVALFPAVPAFRRNLALTFNNFGILLKNTGRAADAETMYGQAMKVLQQLAIDYPAVPDHHNDAAGAMVNLARMRLFHKDLAGARQLLDDALPHHRAALNAAPNDPAFRRYFRNNRWRLAETLVELKDHAAAATCVDEFLQAAVEPPRDAYTAACLFASCVRLAAQDPNLPEDRRRAAAATYGNRALDALRQAVDQSAREVAQIKTDAKLDPLRSRADFQSLAEKATAGRQP